MLKERIKGIVIGVVWALVLIIAVPALGGLITSTIQVTYSNIGVSIDGKTIYTEQKPFVFEGNTYLAVGDIAEAFNAEIKMNETTNTLEITTQKAVQTASATNKNQKPANPSITRERAEQIAVDWLEQDGVSGAWRDGGISMDFERGCWVWEIEFKNRIHEWEFYIDVNTGEIVHVDVDRD